MQAVSSKADSRETRRCPVSQTTPSVTALLVRQRFSVNNPRTSGDDIEDIADWRGIEQIPTPTENDHAQKFRAAFLNAFYDTRHVSDGEYVSIETATASLHFQSRIR